jgi:hypothetical protein
VDTDSLISYERILETLGARHDVVSVGAGDRLPLDGFLPETTDEDGLVGVVRILPGYLETLLVPRLKGRLPTWHDLHAGVHAATVTASAARALFGQLDPLGHSIRVKGGDELVIVGIVDDVRQSLEELRRPVVFALPDATDLRLDLVVRLSSRRAGAVPELRRQVGGLVPGEPIVAGWWSDSIDALAPFRTRRFQTAVLGTFAFLALGLTTLGVFAVVSLAATRRTREMGVRLALGARPASLVFLILRRVLEPIAAGGTLGVLLALAASSFLEARLFGVDAGAPIVLAAALVLVILAAGLAAYLPARAASGVDPVDVLRCE